ncbi:MAG: hypothetical protein HWD60_02420 [Defluviicoccus sp.]|nr:MAG: hypothetical protein HWD60_02420 [Defluviicoccus sp.]
MEAFSAPAGTSGDDTLVGDITSENGEEASLTVAAGNAEESVDGADNEVVRAYLSTLSGGNGVDLIAGDVYAREGGTMNLSVRVGAGGDYYGAYYDPPVASGQGGSRNDVLAFADHLLGGSGDDVIVGDILTQGTGASVIQLDVARGGQSLVASSGDGGSDNEVRACNDLLVGDLGNDTLVGDVFAPRGNTIRLYTSLGAGGSPIMGTSVLAATATGCSLSTTS